MATFQIPIPEGLVTVTFQVELEGVFYDFTLRWNARDRHWFLTVGLDGEVNLAGVKLVNSDDLLGQFARIEDLPPGTLKIVDLDGFDRDPDDENFGDRVALQYETSDGA